MNLAASPAERSSNMPGDNYLRGGLEARIAMTRAVSIGAPAVEVWPWIAQMGRGAGWYSYDRLDNGGLMSARHIVSWIPDPRLGDATAIGYLRQIDVGRGLVWWADGVQFLGARTRLVMDFRLEPEGETSRLISRNSAAASGWSARPALWLFWILDSIMAGRQLRGIRARVESSEDCRLRAHEQESGARDQYQLYEVYYAAGDSAGVAGREHGARWRRSAIEDGVLEATPNSVGGEATSASQIDSLDQ